MATDTLPRGADSAQVAPAGIPPATKKPQRLVKIALEHPFITDMRTERGAWVSSNAFDVPDEEYGAGNFTGFQYALDLVRMVKEAKGTEREGRAVHLFNSAMWEAAEIIAKWHALPATEKFSVDRPSRHGAAVGFRLAVQGMVHGAIEHCNVVEWLQGQIDAQKRANEQCRTERERERAEFVQRMAAARKARAEARAVAALSSWSGIRTSQCLAAEGVAA